jgi:hypothetical protein
MYRNIFRGAVPSYFLEFRGDTNRTLLHLMYSNKKVKVLNFVGSVYTFGHTGIWSAMNKKDQVNYEINYYSQIKNIVISEYEKAAIGEMISSRQNRLNELDESLMEFPSKSIAECAAALTPYMKQYSSGLGDYIGKSLYYSEYIDTLCAALGEIYRNGKQEIPEFNMKAENICVIIDDSAIGAEYAYRTIEKISDRHNDQKIYVVFTGVSVQDNGLRTLIERQERFSPVQIPEACTDAMDYLNNAFTQISPIKTYCFISQCDALGQMLINARICETVGILPPKNGYYCGIANPNFDAICVGRQSDAEMLKRLGRKVIFDDDMIHEISCDNQVHDIKYFPQLFHDNNWLINITPREKPPVQKSPPAETIDPVSEADRRIAELKASNSYRIGRMATWPARKLKKIFHR